MIRYPVVSPASSIIIGDALVVANLAALKALSSPYPNAVITQCRTTQGDQGGGTWVFRSGDQSANVSADTLSGIWAAPSSASSGSSGAWQRQWTDQINTAWFTARDGSNDTAALNAAHSVAFSNAAPLAWQPGTYYVTESSPGAGYAVLNEGVSYVAPPELQVTIRPLASMPNTADFILLRPRQNNYLDFLQLQNIFINPSDALSVVRGRYGIHMLFDRSGLNMNEMLMDGIYIAAGNDYSLRIENPVFSTTISTTNGSPTATVASATGLAIGMTVGSANIPDKTTITNISGTTLTLSANATGTAGGTGAVFAYNFQGVPANSRIQGCQFMSGCYLSGVGDSVKTYGNTVRGSNIGWRVYQINISGVAGEWLSQGDNMDCAGGLFRFESANCPKIRDCNLEMSAGAGSNGAMIDFDGSSQNITVPEVSGCHMGAFGTATVTRAIRLGSTTAAVIDRNNITGVMNYGIDVTANSSSAKIGPGNNYNVVTAAVLNNGTATETNGVPLLSYTPTVTSETGSITSSSASGYYQRVGKLITVYGTVTITTAGTAGGFLNVSIPVTSLRAAAMFAAETGVTGKGCIGRLSASSSTASFKYDDGTTIFANGAIINFFGLYEIA
jgi:hypothetical protein